MSHCCDVCVNFHTCTDVHQTGPESGDIRLFGDTRNGYGAVEIYSSRLSWQGICPDSSWTDSDAATICQDLGYENGIVIPPITVISTSTNRVPSALLRSANCPGRSVDPLTLGVCSFQIAPTFSSCRQNGSFASLKCCE